MSSPCRIGAILWASPYTLVALLLGAAMRLLGGSARVQSGCVEFAWRPSPDACGRWLRLCPYRAITLGHVILAVTATELQALRAHEHAHVRQYERWGVFFGPAYLASSVWQGFRGRDMYRDNHFEVQARRAAGP